MLQASQQAGFVIRKFCWRLPLTASLGNWAKFKCCLTIAKQADATAPEIPRPHVARSVSSDNIIKASQWSRDKKAEGPTRRLVLLEFPEGAALLGMAAPVMLGSEQIGRITSTAFGHTINRALAFAYLPKAQCVDEQTVLVSQVETLVRLAAPYDPKSLRSRA